MNFYKFIFQNIRCLIFPMSKGSEKILLNAIHKLCPNTLFCSWVHNSETFCKHFLSIQLFARLRKYRFHSSPKTKNQLPYFFEPVLFIMGRLQGHQIYPFVAHVIKQSFSRVSFISKNYHPRTIFCKVLKPFPSSTDAGVISNAVI